MHTTQGKQDVPRIGRQVRVKQALTRAILCAAVTAIGLPGSSTAARAEGSTAYLHQLVRASTEFGTAQARVFYHEAKEGQLELVATRTALDEQSSTITNIAAWLESIRRMQSSAENQTVGRHVVEMRALATKAGEITRMLQDTIAGPLEEGVLVAGEELALTVADQSTELFQTFDALRKTSSTIAGKLELPKLEDPPVKR